MTNSLVGKKFEITCKFYGTKSTVEVTSTNTKNMYGKDYTVCNYVVLASDDKHTVGKTNSFLEIDLTMGLKRIVEVA